MLAHPGHDLWLRHATPILVSLLKYTFWSLVCMLPRANTALAFFLLVLQGLFPALALAPAGTGNRTLTTAMQATLRVQHTYAYLLNDFCK